MIPIAKPDIGKEEIDAVSKVMTSGIIAEGKRVAEFESAFADYIGTEHAVAVNSGTAALHTALLAHGIGKGDEVITTSFSFIATANSIMYTGAKPVFADIDPETFNIDPEKIEDSITNDTKALMPVHLYGHPAEMKAINEIAEDHGLAIIEDACQAHGAIYNGKKVGSFGTGAFSFYPTKNMTTGEGGIITTNDSEVARKARMIRAHGSQERYLHEMVGYNFRMTDIAAAIGLVQLKKIERYNSARRKNAYLLSERLKDIPGITVPTIRKGCGHVFHQYTIRVNNREELVTKLKQNEIGTGVYYPIPIHMQPTYIEAGYNYDLPICEKAAKEVVSLPVHPGVSEQDIEQVIENVIAGVK
ncbi:DegT/DnrJ/EryC1/StrS aminotransferase family protein [Methanococcoides methylutens]|uniref:UDP-4-amino-4-deoxy-L-arabinose--oxoglutarate aminotransferase n=1 Tax=Methanococcoides methylutens MM1 TaxID=1434104 RepID=A0A0E3WZE0_METMT|nr:DegT/DnrJ/EryC1/StrS family aminotransferase [Methanococcoides methylutens]AKB84744.1 UDP-4-amino-4-deoxy-L-arabinose--oxoglutarate aminotransferase [Methanococcoides methylutens MM1]